MQKINSLENDIKSAKTTSDKLKASMKANALLREEALKVSKDRQHELASLKTKYDAQSKSLQKAVQQHRSYDDKLRQYADQLNAANSKITAA